MNALAGRGIELHTHSFHRWFRLFEASNTFAKLRLFHARAVQSGMSHLPPVDQRLPKESDPGTLDRHAFAVGWILFIGLFVIVLGILWAINVSLG